MKPPARGAGMRLVRMEIRPIDNGFIVSRHHSNGRGDYKTTEHFTDQDPVVKSKPGAVQRASGPIKRKDV